MIFFPQNSDYKFAIIIDQQWILKPSWFHSFRLIISNSQGDVYFHIITQKSLKILETFFNHKFIDLQGKYSLYQNNEKLQKKGNPLFLGKNHIFLSFCLLQESPPFSYSNFLSLYEWKYGLQEPNTKFVLVPIT